MVIDLEQECSLESVSRLLGIDRQLCRRIRERPVERGRRRKGVRLPKHLAADEKSFAKRHKYATAVYDTDTGTVEDVIEKREQRSLEAYYEEFPFAAREAVETISMICGAPTWRPGPLSQAY
jgi:transposase